MKRLTQMLGIVLLTFLTINFVQAQDVSLDEILENYFENIGGKDAWKKIESMKMTGKSAGGQMPGEIPVTIYSMAPNQFKMELDIGGKKFIQAYDGETAWMLNPFTGGTEPQKQDEESTKSMAKQKFQDEFIDYKKKGHTVELEGREEVDGTDAYKVKMTKKSGDIVFYYFDSENFVPIMTRSFMDSGPAKGQIINTYMSEYQEVDGLMVPHSTEQKIGDQTMFAFTAEKIEFDSEDVTKETFAFPAASTDAPKEEPKKN